VKSKNKNMDTHSINQIALLHPIARIDCTNVWTEVQAAMPQDVIVRVGESLRSFERTDALYKLGRTVVNPDGKSEAKPMGNIVSWAKAGLSWHDWGLAFDMAMLTNGQEDWVIGPNWMKVVAIMKKHGWDWGGDFPEGKKDGPHFEKKYGQTLQGLITLHSERKFIPGTKYVQINI
jgi:peptidoglycan L-alanyl-D-glutamate endopeptidase CwlK